MKKRLKALVVEDHAMFRNVVVRTLLDKLKFDEVNEAGTCTLAKETFAPDVFDLVVLDFDLPDGNGLDLAALFTAADPRLRVAAVSAQTDDFTLTRVLDSGVMAFIDKTEEDLDRLTQAITDVMEWRMYFSRSVHEAQMREKLDPAAFSKRLTEKETSLMRFFGMGMRNEDIAPHLGVEAVTIQGHRKSVMKKLGVSSAPELMRLALRHGFTRLSDIHRPLDED
jgi:two-component system response regulator NreC